MRFRTTSAAVLALAAAIPAAIPASADVATALGRWKTAGGGAQIEVYRCGDRLCGRIAWLRQPNGKDGTLSLDDKNPDPAKRTQPILGLTMLWGLKQTGPREWTGGRVYNPDDGSSYGAQLTLQPDGRLTIRGYLGVPLLGGSETWTRAE